MRIGKRFEYVDRPTELEAYRHTVKEARRLGMSDEEIVDYLKVTWLDEEEVRRLARTSGSKDIPQKQSRASSADYADN